MLTLTIPADWHTKILRALQANGRREVGGILMAEHVGPDHFVVREVTVHRAGTFSSFIRLMEEALTRLQAFFDRAKGNYRQFNYIGEWHSHPSFLPTPSAADDASMREIVGDLQVGANFVVLLVVKLDTSGAVVGTVHTYLPNGQRYPSTLKLE